MMRKQITKALQRITILTIILSLLSGTVSPHLAIAVENARAQNYMQSILDADLSEYEGERFPYIPPKNGAAESQPENVVAESQLDHIKQWVDESLGSVTQDSVSREPVVWEQFVQEQFGQKPVGTVCVEHFKCSA